MNIDWTEDKTKKLKEMYAERIPRYGMSLILGCSEGAINNAIQRFVMGKKKPKTVCRVEITKRKVALKTGELYALHDLGLPKSTFVRMVRKEDIPKEFKIVF